MTVTQPARRRFDAPTLESHTCGGADVIVVVMLTALHDFLLSDVLSLPGVFRRGPLVQVRALDRVASSLELAVPVAILALMVILW